VLHIVRKGALESRFEGLFQYERLKLIDSLQIPELYLDLSILSVLAAKDRVRY
jgi:hypothetical protein